MKKVLVLVAAMLLVAANAMAFSSVVKSKHNMTTGYVGSLMTGTTTEVCVFCHTPHGADVSNKNAPLWNRTLASKTYTYYNSATLSTFSRSANVSTAIANSDAPLCLSCHDGQSVVSVGLQNAPNGAGTVAWTGAYSWPAGDGARANITSNLSNDHPIGMNYVAVQAATGTGSDAGGFIAVGASSGSYTNNLTFYNGSRVWCSSCHDVHSDSNYPFLAKSNAGSGLCLSCHIK